MLVEQWESAHILYIAITDSVLCNIILPVDKLSRVASKSVLFVE